MRPAPTRSVARRTSGLPGLFAALCFLLGPAGLTTVAQEAPAEPPATAEESSSPGSVAEEASLTAEVGEEGGRIVVEAKGVRPKVPFLFSAQADQQVRIGTGGLTHTFGIKAQVVQGKARTLSLGLGGAGEILSATGEGLTSWSVRREGADRFLDLTVDATDGRKEFQFEVKARVAKVDLPSTVEVLHLRQGKAVGFTSALTVTVPASVTAKLSAIDGFLPLESEDDSVRRFQGALGKRLALALSRSSAVSAPVELTNAWLEGTVDEKAGHASFVLRGTAEVAKDGAVIDLLRGQAAAEDIPVTTGYSLRLETDRAGKAVYRLKFPKAGSYPVEIRLAARLVRQGDWRALDFTLPSGAIVPVVLRGVPAASEYNPAAGVVPTLDGEAWRGFLPLSGQCALSWKRSRTTGEGKLFFTTEGRVNVGVGAGLLRQTTIIDYRILQGKLDELVLDLIGPGEILTVDLEGATELGWEESEEGGARRLTVRLNQPIEKDASIRVRSQIALDAFPVRATPLRIIPAGAVRHSGYIRVYNIGATSLEVAGVQGLTQLSPDQFPEQNLPGGDRQTFVYRFPSAAHQYEVVADRVQPEVNVSQITVYELSDSDRVIRADLNLEILQAPLRDWSLKIPADYLVVSVTGAEVTDHLPGTVVENNERTLKVSWGKEMIGRQVVRIHLEKNEAVEAGNWAVPRLQFPGAKSVRGEIGVASAPGFRISAAESSKLTEIPINRFQGVGLDTGSRGERTDLQQAFRIRERDWSASMTIESLPQSVQADVFHLYALKDRTAYASVVINYFITGAPVSEWKIRVPAEAENIYVEGLDVRNRTRDVETGELTVSLHRAVVGPYTLLLTYEESVAPVEDGQVTIRPGQVAPLGVRSERGFIQVVSPVQVDAKVTSSENLITLEPMELPAEFRLLSAAPPLATFQYPQRGFDLEMAVDWYEPGETIPQVVGFAEASSRVSRDGEVLTEVVFLVKTRGRPVFRVRLPDQAESWVVTVGGEDVTARKDGADMLIPLPAGVDANAPVEVAMRLAKPAPKGNHVVLTLPSVSAPTLKAKWRIEGEQGHVLVPKKSSLPLGVPVLTESGLEWIGNRAIGVTALLFILLAAGLWIRAVNSRNCWLGLGGISCLLVAFALSLSLVGKAQAKVRDNLGVLEFTLPVVAPGEPVTLIVGNYTEWAARLNTWGILAIVIGAGLLLGSVFASKQRFFLRFGGSALVAVGLLAQRGGAVPFYLVAAIAIFLLLLPWLVRWWGDLQRSRGEWQTRRTKEREQRAEDEKDSDDEKEEDGAGGLPGPATSLIALGLLFGLGGIQDTAAKDAAPPPALVPGMVAADAVKQDWKVVEGRLKGSGTLQVTGRPGDTVLLLKSPAVLTGFDGERLRVSKRTIEGIGAAYAVSIRGADEDQSEVTLNATFTFEMQVGARPSAIPVPTGASSVQEVSIQFDKGGWEFDSAAAMRITAAEGLPEGQSGATLLLAPLRNAQIDLKAKARDVAAEETQFFAEVANLFLPSPGVIDGRHALRVRPSQGEVRELTLSVPQGFTVSNVGSGPVSTWQFDADSRELRVVIEPAQSVPFALLVETQSSLAALPTDATVAPLAVVGAVNDVGLVALAFGNEAQLENATPTGLSEVNLADFDASLIPDRADGKPVLRGVYRYGQGGGTLAVRVAPVAPELRVNATQVVSIGDERLVVGVSDFTVDIARAGIFQLSFPLPAGLEVDSLTGTALRHFTELTEDDGSRLVVMHLNGKTIGPQRFSLALSGPAPASSEDGWLIPRFELREANRQTGDLIVKPTTGIELKTIAGSRRNVSEIDPRDVGGQGRGALAFRILQRDWEVRLAITKLDPWVSGQILHEVTLREGQTRNVLAASLRVENASIRSLDVRIPGLSPAEVSTVRASGGAVSDIVQSSSDGDLWTIQFKRRVVGDLDLRIEWERTDGQLAEDADVQVDKRIQARETLRMVQFPLIRQTPAYYFAVRAGARLELDEGEMPKDWQRIDWNNVPATLRQARDRSIPAQVIRALPVAPAESLELTVSRHSVQDALDLRVSGGSFTTVISPVKSGKLLTSVDLNVDVIQRGNLRLTLPEGGRLYNVFVNGESVNIVRDELVYQFFVLPGADGRSAKVRFVYSTPHRDLQRLRLDTPMLSVPLENIDWHVVVPDDFELVRHDGMLDLSEQRVEAGDTREQYLVSAREQRAQQALQGTALLDQVNLDLQAGEQIRARQRLKSVAGNYALDAASNEDARVQLQSLQTRQALVGLNTRRQRMYLDNKADDPSFQRNDQLEQAARGNRILTMNEARFRRDEISQLLEGNTKEDNAVLTRIASRLVTHQRSTEPAPQAISVTLPEEGRVYTFSRSVQVAKDAPLSLELKFQGPQLRSTSREAFVLLLTLGICAALVIGWKRRGSA